MGVTYLFRARPWGKRPPDFSVFSCGKEEEASTSLPKHISLSRGLDEMGSSD